MRALVLSGGGVKGAYQVGVLQNLVKDRGLSYDILCGISVGALNCAFLGLFSKTDEITAIDQLSSFWSTVENNTIRKEWCPFGKLHALWLKSMYNSQPLIDLIRSHLDMTKVRASGKKISVGAVSLTTGHYRTFTQDDDNLADGVLASSAFPGGLKPIEIDGELYTDGGVKHITPLAEAIALGADEIDVIICCPVMTTTKYDNSSTTLTLALRTIDLMTDEIIAADLKKAQLYNKIALLDPSSDKKFVKINIIRPIQDLTTDSLDFDHDTIMKMMAQGYQDAKNTTM